MAAPVLHINAIQTVIPAEVTDPGRRRRIHAAAPILPEALQNRLYIVLYYQKAEESALEVGAWIKETLNAALPEQPVLAGRLRKENDGSWEIKCNDAGVRLVQATVPEVSMLEFLKNKELREESEAHLVYWTDIDHDKPDFSALFNIQVTQFKEHGYSIGISCSLLLADPFFLARFLKSWLHIHAQMMMAQSKFAQPSIFHLSYFQRPDRPKHLKSIKLKSSPIASTTVLFMMARTPSAAPPDDIVLAAACLEVAARRRLEKKQQPAAATFTVMINDHSGDLKMEQGNVTRASNRSSVEGWFGGGQAPREVGWEELGLEGLAFESGNKPIQVSCQIVSSEELVMVMARTRTRTRTMTMAPLEKDMQFISVILSNY